MSYDTIPIGQVTMPNSKSKKNSPAFSVKVFIIATIVVSILGYIDYLTGEISIDLLYLLCIGMVTWHTNMVFGILCVIEIFFAKTTADYFCQIKVGTHLYEWNSLNDIIIYLLVCLLVDKLRKVLTT